MKIKTKFQIIMAVFLSLAIALGSIIFLTVQDMNKTMEKNRITKELVKEVFELNIVSHDYIMYHDERAKTQCQLKYDSIEMVLSEASEKFNNSEEKTILKDIRQTQEDLESVFFQLVTNYEQNLSKEENATFLELEERLITQLKVKSLRMISLADQLNEISHKEVVVTQERGNSLTVLFIVLMGAMMVIASFWVNRSVLKPITKFQKGAESIAKGNLDNNIKIVKRDDEIENLARSFETMRLNLKKSINKIKRARNNLEIKVKERTKELEEAQEELVRKEKLAILGQLAGGVGHELRNPLGAMKNAVYFLNMVLVEPEPEIKETLEILNKEISISEKMIGSLLDFARPKPPAKEKVDVNGLVREAFSSIIMGDKIAVVSQLDEAVPHIMADPFQLSQVFGNIVLNAIQAMPEGGKLVIRTETTAPDEVTITFEDNGVGISEENLKKVFEPLFTTKAKGIGLGLAVIKTLVERHGGSVTVASEVDKGSTFTVKLPIGKMEEEG